MTRHDIVCTNPAGCITHLFQEVTEALEATGKLDSVMFTPNGPAGIFAVYVTPGLNLGRVFLNEFIVVRPFIRHRPSTLIWSLNHPILVTGLHDRPRHLGLHRPD